MRQSLLAKKYAQSFFNIFGATLKNEDIEQIRNLSKWLDENRQLLLYIHYEGSQDMLQKLHKVCQEFCGGLVPLIELLAEEKRVILLPQVLQWLEEVFAQYHGIEYVTIESAVALADDDLKKLITYFEQKTGKKAVYTVKENKELIAGIRLYSAHYYFENSIRAKLQALLQNA